MSKKSKLILAFLILVCLPSPRFQQNRVRASDGYPVHNLNTGLNYTTIQEAINANETMNKHTILVEAGNYDERIIIDKSISLIGQNRTDTLLSTKEYFFGTSINVTCDDVEVADFSFPLTFLTKIWVGLCSNVTIRNNIIRSTRQCIVLNGSHNCNIKGNDISGPGLEENDLIQLIGASECTIENNSVLNACYDGIGLYSSSNNVICNNMISQNQYGIEFRGTSTGNSIFHNNFVSNHPFQVSGSAGSNMWDNGLEGNYWSDYNGTDSNKDGIGDTPYAVDQYNVDHYPLMGSFYGPWVRGSGQVDVVSNSTVSNFWFIIDVVWGGTFLDRVSFDVSGDTGTNGFCRVHLSYDLFNSTYTVLVNGTEVSYALLSCSNSTDSYLHFTYTHSTKKVEILPEFPSLFVLPLFMIATLLVLIVYKRRHLT
jgi:parallel beta-helix repeat protein